MITQANPTPHPLRQFTKQWKLGVLLYYLYYAPKGLVEPVFRKGLFNLIKDAQTQRQMEAAAYELPTVQSQSASIDIHFLTGKKFWYQTCFCAYSMMQHSDVSLRPALYDDGTLSAQYTAEIQRIFPNAVIVSEAEILDRLNTHLPEARFPYLRERRENYPNLKKLIDVHLGSSGWKLVLDSDMLFFRSPTLLLDWLRDPQIPCHMVDIEDAYGYSRTLMSTLAGAEIPDRLNVGICGLKSEDIDWEQLEYWCKTMIEQQGTNYYQEQALVAMLMAGHDRLIVPAAEYIVMPEQAEVRKPDAVLHHYVADSKSWYFRYGWQQVLQVDRTRRQP